MLVPGSYEYQRFVSDLAGFDPRQHELSAGSIIREVASWLKVQEDTKAPYLPALRVFERYPAFMDDVRRLEREALGRSNWIDILDAAERAVLAISASAP